MTKEIMYDDELRALLINGAMTLSRCVKSTLGPSGRHVIMQRDYKSPIITNDGVSIAKMISLSNPYEDLGAKLVYESANKTNEHAGDGTTTSILLAVHMLQLGMQAMKQKANPSNLVKGMNLAKDAILEILTANTKKISSYEDIKHLATIASKSEEIGSIISEALKKVEEHDYIHVETSPTIETKIRVEEGMHIDARTFSFAFFKDKPSVIFHHAALLICNQSIETISQIENIAGYYLANGKPLIILCRDMSDEVLSSLLLSRLQRKSDIIAYKAPSFGDYQNDILDDIACISNGVLQQERLDMDLSTMSIEDLGMVDKAILTKDGLQLYASKNDEVKRRVVQLKENLSAMKQPYDIAHTLKRIANLDGKLACIEVGGYTDIEIEEKKLRIEDALQATKAAEEEGITWGGGLAFIEAYRELHPILHDENKDVEMGIQIIFHSILQPFMQLCENAYLDSEEMLQKQLAQELPIGFHAQELTWVNLEESGIMDPFKVIKEALINAVSVASLLIRCDVAIVNAMHEQQR